MHIVDRKTEYSTPWFELLAKWVKGDPAPYYSLKMLDYVAIVPFTREGELVLVRQYRPAVERYTLELPSGHVEKGETPAFSAARELSEECGLQAPEIAFLGAFASDTGRHDNRLWCYLAKDAVPIESGYIPEAGIERILVPRAKIPELLSNPEFDHALHFAALMVAVTKEGPAFLALK